MSKLSTWLEILIFMLLLYFLVYPNNPGMQEIFSFSIIVGDFYQFDGFLINIVSQSVIFMVFIIFFQMNFQVFYSTSI